MNNFYDIRISWAGSTWNPWYGCKKVSQGCKFCYADREITRYGKDFSVVEKSKTLFDAPLKWFKNKSKDIGTTIFTCSWSDWFIEEADEYRDDAWKIVKDTPYIYLILTKRPERIYNNLPKDWGSGYPNVYLGVTIESDQHIGRGQILSAIPCITRFLSYEPAIAPLDVRDMLYDGYFDWVIGGGESGENPRETNPIWMKRVQQNCDVFNVPFFFKQNGGSKKINGIWGGDELEGKTYKNFPEMKKETIDFLNSFR